MTQNTESCQIEGCSNIVFRKKKQLCRPHDRRLRYTNGESAVSAYDKQNTENLQICIAINCDQFARTKSVCPRHYYHLITYGDPNHQRPKKVKTKFIPINRECDSRKCNNIFLTTHPTSKYCSKKCKNQELGRIYQERHPSPFKSITCENCAEIFESRNSRIKCCSKDCNRLYKSAQGIKARRKHREQNPLPPKQPKPKLIAQSPVGFVTLFQIKDSNGLVYYIGTSKRNFKAIISAMRHTIRPSKIRDWLIATPDAVIEPLMFLTQSEAPEILRLARRTGFDAGYPLLCRESLTRTEEERTEIKRVNDRIHDERREMRKRDAYVEDIHRAKVLQTYNGICHICLTSVDSSDWELEHIIPLARGGKHSYDNVAPSHPNCNNLKGSKLMSELPLEEIRIRMASMPSPRKHSRGNSISLSEIGVAILKKYYPEEFERFNTQWKS